MASSLFTPLVISMMQDRRFSISTMKFNFLAIFRAPPWLGRADQRTICRINRELGIVIPEVFDLSLCLPVVPRGYGKGVSLKHGTPSLSMSCFASLQKCWAQTKGNISLTKFERLVRLPSSFQKIDVDGIRGYQKKFVDAYAKFDGQVE